MRLFASTWLLLGVQCLCSNVFIACEREQLIFQSVSKNISFQLEEDFALKVLGSLKDDDRASLSSESNAS